jgi:hypothetical protein
VSTIVVVLLFILGTYAVGLRVSWPYPFLRLDAPSRVFAWIIHGAARSRLRKRESILDFFRYRAGAEPENADLARLQWQFIASFFIILLVHLWAS